MFVGAETPETVWGRSQKSHCGTKRLNKIKETLCHAYRYFFVLKKAGWRKGGLDMSCDFSPWLTFSSAARSASLSSRSTPLSSASESGPGGPSRCWTLLLPAGGDTVHSARKPPFIYQFFFAPTTVEGYASFKISNSAIFTNNYGCKWRLFSLSISVWIFFFAINQ